MGKGARGFLLGCALAAVAFAIVACPKQVTTCMSNSDCDAGFACQNQACVNVTCDGGCDGGFSCINSICVSPNCPTGPCAPGLVCDLSCLAGLDASVCSGACVSPACINICPQGEACTSDGTCLLKGCIGKICPYNDVCIDAQCFDRGCLDAGCPSGTSCANGICYDKNCPDAGTCGTIQVCFDGGCADPQCFGVSCPMGDVCVQGLCNLPSCSDMIQDGNETDIDCGGPECTGCQVGQKCGSDTDCLTRFCNGGHCQACVADNNCSAGELCNVDAGDCTGCYWNDCPGGQVCFSDTQLCGPCGSTQDCDGGGVCLGNGTCGPCTMTSQCGTQICQTSTGLCIPCSSDSQCLNNFVCVAQNCGPCTNDNQCPAATPHCNTTSGQCLACTTYYQDLDGDGYGNSNVSQCVTTQPAGYVTASGDCDDNDPKVHPGQTLYFTVARDSGTYDYNCDGVSSADPQFNCAETLVCDVCSATQCTGGPGYDAGVPACGGSGAFCYCAFADPDAGVNDGGVDGGLICDPSLAGTATCAGGSCPAGHAEYQTLCATQQIGCH